MNWFMLAIWLVVLVISAKIASALLVISMLIVDLDSLLKVMYSFYILSVVKVAIIGPYGSFFVTKLGYESDRKDR